MTATLTHVHDVHCGRGCPVDSTYRERTRPCAARGATFGAGEQLVCTRVARHDGEHAGCGPAAPLLTRWDDDPAR